MGATMLHTFAAQRSRVRALLEARGLEGATTPELTAPYVGGSDGARRVRELRNDLGLSIQRARIANGYWRYWLGPTPPNAQLDLFWEEDSGA